jgi:thioredoxin 1
MYNNKKIKILVTSIVVVLVILVWLIKNGNENKIADVSQPKGDSEAALETAEQDTSEFALHVTDELDMEKLKSYGLPIIIDFGADTCDPCKEMAPVLKELNESLRGKAIIKFVDVWKYQEIGEIFPLQVIPTQFFFDKDGKPYVPSDNIGIKFTKYSRNDNNEHVYTVHEGGLTKDQMLTILEELGME